MKVRGHHSDNLWITGGYNQSRATYIYIYTISLLMKKRKTKTGISQIVKNKDNVTNDQDEIW